MFGRRALLRAVASIWLSSQFAAFVGAPLVTCANAADARASECRCTHGGDAACPMHHLLRRGSRLCLMQTAADWTTAVLTSVLGVVGLTAAPVAIAYPRALERLGDNPTRHTLAQFMPPDPPPPRSQHPAPPQIHNN